MMEKTKKHGIEYCRDTLLLVKNIEGNFLTLAGRLCKIHDDELWAGSWDSYDQFLSDANIKSSRASMLETVYRTYVVEGNVEPLKLAECGYSKLYAAMPLLSEKTASEVVEWAIPLRREEINTTVKENRTGVHDCEAGEERFGLCKTCRKWLRLQNEL